MNSRNLKIGTVKLLSQLLSFSLVVGCSHFSGPGEFRTSSDKASPQREVANVPQNTNSFPPSISMQAERFTNQIHPEVAFQWPVEEARLSRGFQLGRRHHWGLDLANRRGTKIMAAEAGTVIYTGKGFRGYGKLIVIEHNGEWATMYSHLDKIEVQEGQQVRQGESIGKMGNTGRAHGVHLHFEIRQNRQPVNPLAFLPSGVISSL